MGKAKILGDISKIDKNIEVCRTTNKRISSLAAQLLMKNQIPFSEDQIRIPFFLRKKYRGAKQFYVIETNRNRYGQARRAIDQMDSRLKRRIVFSNY